MQNVKLIVANNYISFFETGILNFLMVFLCLCKALDRAIYKQVTKSSSKIQPRYICNTALLLMARFEVAHTQTWMIL